jgi:hypothetical protein
MSDSSAKDAADVPRAAGTGGDWCSPRRFALVLAVLIFVPFWNVLLGLDTFAVRDFGLFSYPCASFQRQCFWQGELPWWNPLSCCGLPFLAQFNTLALYPPALIYLLLPLTWSLPFFCLLHLFLGGMGMYFLAARWTGSRAGAALAGVVFAFNGLALNFLMWPSHTATFAWMPWVILLTEAGWKAGGRKLVPATLAAALQILAGGPESILFTWLILLAMGLVECGRGTAAAGVLARRFFLMGILAVCLAAAQLLPSADFALHCSRNTHYAASEWAMPAWGWANFLVPMFQTAGWQGMAVQFNQYWTSSYYAGIGVVFLAAVALWRRVWRVWLIGGFVAASLVLALGDHGFVYFCLRRLFPFLGLFRFPIKFVIITSALLPLLAAFAMSQYENWPGGAARLRRAEVMCGGGIVILIGTILWFARHHPVPGSSWPATLGNALPRLVFLAVFLWAVYFFATRPAQRHWSVLLPVAVCWLDLITAMPWQNPTLDPSIYQPGLAQMTDKLNPEPNVAESRLMLSSFSERHIYYEPARDLKTTYLLDRAVFLSDCNLLDNFPKVNGFFSLYLRESGNVLGLLDAHSGAQLASLQDFLCVSQTVAPGKIFDWMPRATFLPIVTAGQEPIFADDQTAFSAIGQTNVDFRKVVYLPPEAKAGVTAKREPAAQIIGKQFGASKETIQVETPGPTMVYISQAYYHNWKAQVDGKAVPLWRANYAFQAVEVPAGKHEVTLMYSDRMFWIGTLLTAGAGLICVALWSMPGGREEGCMYKAFNINNLS